MSEVTTPSSGSRSPALSQSSHHTSLSDTTPSPSGGKRSPPFNPHRLSSKLALLEASESLAQAAETLSVAAKAMSKAATSLAVASGYQDFKYNNKYDSYTTRLGNDEAAGYPADYPDWQQTSYACLSPDTQGQEDNVLLETEEIQSDGPEYTTTILRNTNGEAAPNAGINHNQTTPSEEPFGTQPAATSTTSPKQQSESLFHGEPNQEADVMTTSLRNGASTEEPQEATVLGTGVDQLGDSATGPSHINSSVPDSDSATPLPTSEPVQAPTSTTPQLCRRRIILDSGFDQLPLVCALSTRHAKIICFYKYRAATQVVGTIFRNNISHAIIIPSATDPALAAKEFMKHSSAVLLWPSRIALPTSHEFLALSEAHTVHLGYPSEENANFEAAEVTVVLTKGEFDHLDPETRDSISERYSLDETNDHYNQQGPGSALHRTRTWMRTRLAKNPSARGFFLAWIGLHRRHNPRWTAEELVRRANEYAEEYLLRGEPRTSKHIGGRIPLTKTEVRSMKLEPAVQAGILLVS